MACIINASTSAGLVQSADTSGNLVLQNDGTTKMTIGSSITMNTGGLITSGTAVASTSGTSIDFTSIPSWVKRITVMFQSVSTNGSSNVQVQLGISTGIDSTSTYKGSCSRNASIGTTNYTTGFLITQTVISTSVLEGCLQLNLLSSNNWVGMGVIGYSDGAAGSFTAGSKSLSGTLDRIRITTVNGTDAFDAGSVNILYEG